MTENNKFDKEYQEQRNEAEGILNGDSKNTLGKALDMFMNVPVLGKLAKQTGDIVNMVKDYASGKYKRVPYSTIIKSAMALAYVVSPVDAIPDTIPVVGYVDDYAVVRFVAESVEEDVKEYKSWKADTC